VCNLEFGHGIVIRNWSHSFRTGSPRFLLRFQAAVKKGGSGGKFERGSEHDAEK